MKKLIFLCLTLCSVFAAADEKAASTSTTDLVFILDRSGSMRGLESDTIGGFNSLLEKQKNEPGTAFVTTILFSDKYELLHKREPIQEIKPITKKEYVVGGGTALLDAIGKTINFVKRVQDDLVKEKSDKVLFVIITDGMENSSKEFTLPKLKKLLTDQQEKSDWEFLFLGANIDAISTAESFGIQRHKATEYISDSEGTKKNYEAVSEAVKDIRQGKKLDGSWKAEIEEDVKARKK